MTHRLPFAYVISISGAKVTLNLQDVYSGQYASHVGGIAAVTEVGSLFGVDDGHRLQVMRVRSLSFAEPKEAHRAGVGTTSPLELPLRHLEAAVLGAIERKSNSLIFTRDSLLSPALGAAAFPLTPDEMESIIGASYSLENKQVSVGIDLRSGADLRVNFEDLLSRHVAVLGATGHGKSCLTAAILQQLLKLPSSRIVVFDINGEYEEALKRHVKPSKKGKYTTIGGGREQFKIPYTALGRHGLSRLLLPSEKTQRPALNFAIENLRSVKWFKEQGGAGLECDDLSSAVLFDDCRPSPSACAKKALDLLRSGDAPVARQWPNMRALGCLVAESHSLQEGRYGLERNAFHYSNVAPLVNRIHRYCEDPQFTAVVDIEDRSSAHEGELDWRKESSQIVIDIFGGFDCSWNLHIVNLRYVAHDLLPVILGALLELLAFERFRLGQEASYPTLLVLEEAHHYLRQVTASDEDTHSAPAYERLAKEGRKFDISLWVSTQRPSELSATVLAQCGTWAAFRLTAERDLRAVESAGEWFDRQELDRIAGLPRQQAVIFGSSVAIPIRVMAPTADPIPKSRDPDFSAWSRGAGVTLIAHGDRTADGSPENDQKCPLEDDDIPF